MTGTEHSVQSLAVYLYSLFVLSNGWDSGRAYKFLGSGTIQHVSGRRPVHLLDPGHASCSLLT